MKIIRNSLNKLIVISTQQEKKQYSLEGHISQMDYLATFLKILIPLGTISLYGIGLLHYVGYYNQFHIDIIPHLSATELLTRPVPICILYIKYLVALEIMLLYFIAFIYSLTREKKMGMSAYCYWSLIPNIAEIIYAYSTSDLAYGLLTIIILSKLLILLILEQNSNETEGRKRTSLAKTIIDGIKFKFMNAMSVVFTIIAVVLMLVTLEKVFRDEAKEKAEAFRRNDFKIQFNIVLGDTTYNNNIDTSLRFIGQTTSTVFLYNSKDSNITILSRKDIKKFQFTQKDKTQ